MSLIIAAGRQKVDTNTFTLNSAERKLFNRKNSEGKTKSEYISEFNLTELSNKKSTAAGAGDSSSSRIGRESSHNLSNLQTTTGAVTASNTTVTNSNVLNNFNNNNNNNQNGMDENNTTDNINKIELTDNVNRKKQPKSYTILICTKILKLMFSNVGLILVVFLYSTFGALMFQLLEQHEERRLCEEGEGKYLKELKECRENILLFVVYNLSLESPISPQYYDNQYDYNNGFNLNNYSSTTSRRIKKSLNDNDHRTSSPPVSSTNDKSTLNSTLSLKSLITNVDDNDDAKRSQLNFAFVNQSELNSSKFARLDELLANFRQKVIEIQINTSYYGQNCTTYTKWNFSSSLLFTITIISTIGYGFIVPLTWEGRVVSICYASMGIPIFLLCLANLSSALGSMFAFIYLKIDSLNPVSIYLNRRRKEKKAKKREKKRSLYASRKANGSTTESSSYKDYKHVVVLQDGASIVTKSELSSNVFGKEMDEFNAVYDFHLTEDENESGDDDDSDDENEQDSMFDKTTHEVPVSLAAFVICLYMFAGTVLFHNFEGWPYSKSFYFVFVTLSTMGFGDLVPGQTPNDRYADLKNFTICFYSLFGMSIIGMCFNVMQYVARRKIYWLISSIQKMSTCLRKKKEANKNFAFTLIEKEKEKEIILNRLKLLQQYENQINAKRRKKHALS